MPSIVRRQVNILISKELHAQLEEFQRVNGLPSLTTAARSAIIMGLATTDQLGPAWRTAVRAEFYVRFKTMLLQALNDDDMKVE